MTRVTPQTDSPGDYSINLALITIAQEIAELLKQIDIETASLTNHLTKHRKNLKEVKHRSRAYFKQTEQEAK